MADAPTDDIAARLEARIAELRAELARLETALAVVRGVDIAYQSGTVDDKMIAFERLKHSKTRKPASAANAALRNACNAKKMSVRDFAEKIREKTRFKQITGGHLSRMADPNGDLLIESELADWIATQIDFPASRWKRVKPSK